MDFPVYTIGHSNRSFDDFAGLLTAHNITRLIDIRTVTRSRANPQFNTEALTGSLAARGITYWHIAALGGLRGRAYDVPPDVNGTWRNRSFHNYADYALSGAFHEGLTELCRLADAARTAIMCAEAVWWRCHRRIVADYLIASGRTVYHIMENGRLMPAELTPGAVPLADATVVYPAQDTLADDSRNPDGHRGE